MRGEYSEKSCRSNGAVETPPLARGILILQATNLPGHGNTPACAGNTAGSACRAGDHRKHPRLRGEYIVNEPGDVGGLETPPLARGIRKRVPGLEVDHGNTPACAGNTTIPQWAGPLTRKHPRLRGEYGIASGVHTMAKETPPLARGIPSPSVRSAHTSGNTPACAGNTAAVEKSPRLSRKHPRLRGEYPIRFSSSRSCWETPPLARGIPARVRRKLPRRGNTPACAGNTSAISGLRGRGRKHPRLRGEYSELPTMRQAPKETPPLARGILRYEGLKKTRLGNTPACAGNTTQL